jgi:S-DNA-T family DNA segregation ATPase FtsK/SpoIIIE
MLHMTEASSEGKPLELDEPPPEADASPEADAPPEGDASPEADAPPAGEAPPEDAPAENPPDDEGPASCSLLFEDLLLLPQPAASARPSETPVSSETTKTFRPI